MSTIKSVYYFCKSKEEVTEKLTFLRERGFVIGYNMWSGEYRELAIDYIGKYVAGNYQGKPRDISWEEVLKVICPEPFKMPEKWFVNTTNSMLKLLHKIALKSGRGFNYVPEVTDYCVGYPSCDGNKLGYSGKSYYVNNHYTEVSLEDAIKFLELPPVISIVKKTVEVEFLDNTIIVEGKKYTLVVK